MLVKGLPLAYNRDLQEDKEPLFDAFDTVEACLELAAVVVDGAELRADRIAARLDDGFLDATTLMEYLIQQGRPPAHGATRSIGQLVGLCEQRGCRRLADLPDDELSEAHPTLGPGVKDVLGVANAVKAFRSYGSTARERWRSSWGGGKRFSQCKFALPPSPYEMSTIKREGTDDNVERSDPACRGSLL